MTSLKTNDIKPSQHQPGELSLRKFGAMSEYDQNTMHETLNE